MIEERQRVLADRGLSKEERTRLDRFLKITANATAYPARPSPRPRLILLAVLGPSTPPLCSGVGCALTVLCAATRGTYRGTGPRRSGGRG
jgi:hypothetical protein